jgi:hypothetical protein
MMSLMSPAQFTDDEFRRLKVFAESAAGKWLLEGYPAQRISEMTNEIWAEDTDWERVKQLRAERAGLLQIPEIAKAALRPPSQPQSDL